MPVEPTKFVIRAEKCPNRRGVEAVLKHFQGSVVSFADATKRDRSRRCGSRAAIPTREQLASTHAAPTGRRRACCVVQDLFDDRLTDGRKFRPAGDQRLREGRHVRQPRGAWPRRSAARSGRRSRPAPNCNWRSICSAAGGLCKRRRSARNWRGSCQSSRNWPKRTCPPTGVRFELGDSVSAVPSAIVMADSQSAKLGGGSGGTLTDRAAGQRPGTAHAVV